MNYNRELTRAYEPIGGSITNTYTFTVRAGYKYLKVWVKALKNSDDITCTVLKDSLEGLLITDFKILKGTSKSEVVRCEAGIYYLIFTASGSMNGQYNVKIGTSTNELQ